MTERAGTAELPDAGVPTGSAGAGTRPEEPVLPAEPANGGSIEPTRIGGPPDPAGGGPATAGAPVEPAGDDAVLEAARRRLAELDGNPVATHVAVYDEIHGALQGALASLDES